MARNLALSNKAASAQAKALGDALNGGYIRIYSGVIPFSADTPISSQILLAEMRFKDPAVLSVENGVVTLDTIEPEDYAVGTGSATFYRCFTAAGVPIMDGGVNIAGSDMTLSGLYIAQGGSLVIRSFVHTVPKDMIEAGSVEDPYEWPEPTILTNADRTQVFASYENTLVQTDASPASLAVTIIGAVTGEVLVTNRTSAANAIVWTFSPALQPGETYSVSYFGPSGAISLQGDASQQAPSFSLSSTADFEWPAPIVFTNIERTKISALYPNTSVATSAAPAANNVVVVNSQNDELLVTNRTASGSTITWTISPALDEEEVFSVSYTGPSDVISLSGNPAEQAPSFVLIGEAAGSGPYAWPTPSVSTNATGTVVNAQYAFTEVATDATPATANVEIIGGWSGIKTATLRSANGDTITWSITPALSPFEPYTIQYTGPSGAIYLAGKSDDRAPSFYIAANANEVSWSPANITNIVDFGTVQDASSLLDENGNQVAGVGNDIYTWRGQLGVLSPTVYSQESTLTGGPGNYPPPRLSSRGVLFTDGAVLFAPYHTYPFYSPFTYGFSADMAAFPHQDVHMFGIGFSRSTAVPPSWSKTQQAPVRPFYGNTADWTVALMLGEYAAAPFFPASWSIGPSDSTKITRNTATTSEDERLYDMTQADFPRRYAFKYPGGGWGTPYINGAAWDNRGYNATNNQTDKPTEYFFIGAMSYTSPKGAGYVRAWYVAKQALTTEDMRRLDAWLALQ